MSTASLSWQSAGQQQLPVGTVVDHLLLSITNPNLSVTAQNLTANATSAVVTLTGGVGNYSATVQAMTAANVPIGNPVSVTFALALPTSISLVLPSVINATVSP